MINNKADLIQLRRDYPDNWTNGNPILKPGEIGIEIGTLKGKIGDGVTRWNDLEYRIVKYKEGTFTPTVTLTGAGTAPQYSTNSGKYTIIGRICFFDIFLSGDGGNEGSGVGIITILLPFPISNDQLQIEVSGGTSLDGSTERSLYINYVPLSSTIFLRRFQSAVNLSDFTGQDQNSTTRHIHLQGQYLI